MLQGFAAFRLAPSRIAPRHSQTTRATNCATPGCIMFFSLFSAYWLSAFNPRCFPQKHSRATRDPEKACLFGERTRGVMNEFSPKAETNDMEQLRTMKRSLRSLFLHLGAMPSSATGGGIPPRPTAPHPVVLFYFILLHLLTFCFQSAALPSET